MIKLSQIRDALYDVNVESSCYFNTKTNEILWHCDSDEEYSTYNDDDEFNEDIISMFDFYTKNDYDIMQDFINTINNDLLRNELFDAIRGNGAYNRFRKITDYNNITDAWYKFKDNEYKKVAEEWCNNNKVKFEKDC